MITRRGLFGILAGAVAAPIVVRSGLLMPVKPALIMPSVDIGYYRYTGSDALSHLAPDPNVKSGVLKMDGGYEPFHRRWALEEWKLAFEKNWALANA